MNPNQPDRPQHNPPGAPPAQEGGAPDIARVTCATHGGRFPWSVVCVHLINGTSRTWRAMHSTFPDVAFDWVCPACLKRHQQGQDDLALLGPVCVHCVRTLRRRDGRPDEPQGDERPAEPPPEPRPAPEAPPESAP